MTTNHTDMINRNLDKDRARLTRDAEDLAEMAAYIVTVTTDHNRNVSGDVERLINYATNVLRRAVQVEKSAEYLAIMDAMRAAGEAH